MTARNDARNRQLARIHVLAKECGMSTAPGRDDDYRSMLWAVGRVRSAKDLDWAGRQRVLDHLSSLARSMRNVAYPGRPHNIDSGDRGPQLRKIEAYLAEAKLPWSYANAMAKRIAKRARIEFCTPDELGKIIAALEYDQRRRRRRAASRGEGACAT